jgi:hypothetical protein
MFSRLPLLPAFVVLPVSLFAQDSTVNAEVTPFRRGQWATQFQVGSSFASLGFLKFRSATRALVLDVRLSGAHSESLVSDTTGMRFAGLSSNLVTQLRFGWRRYDAGAPKVTSHYTLGVLAGLDHRASASRSGSFEVNGWTAGLFGDVGGTYRVTSQLGLGALAGVSLSYSSSAVREVPSNRKGRDWQLGGSAVSAAFVATLFF